MPSTSEPEFFKLKLKKAPKPRDYDCPHNSGHGDTLLVKLQGEGEYQAAFKNAELPKAVKQQEEVKIEEEKVEEYQHEEQQYEQESFEADEVEEQQYEADEEQQEESYEQGQAYDEEPAGQNYEQQEEEDDQY